MNMSDLAAIVSSILTKVESDNVEHDTGLPIPDYVTLSSTDVVSFQMRSFGDVQVWAEYLGTKYEYSEHSGKHYRSNQDGEATFGFANATKRITHYLNDLEVVVTLNINHNELAKPESNPAQPTLEDM